MCGHQSMRHQTDPQTAFLRSLDEGAPVLSLVEAVVQSGSACNEHTSTLSIPYYPLTFMAKTQKQNLFNALGIISSYIKPRALRTTLEQIQMPEAIAAKSGQQNSLVSGCFMMFRGF